MKTHTQNIFLIGPMGAGKSSMGRILARLSGKTFYDSDMEIEKRTGVSIEWIFDVEGEEGFRKREERIIDQLTQLSPIILATGGGSIVSEKNRKHLKERGLVILLEVPLDVQVQRLLHSTRRPVINKAKNSNNLEEKLTQLALERNELYYQIADIKLDSSKADIHSLANEILRLVK